MNLHVEDNFFNDVEFRQIHDELFPSDNEAKYPRHNWTNNIDDLPIYVKKLLDTAYNYFKFDNVKSYEWWIHQSDNTTPKYWHTDLYCKEFYDNGNIILSECSIVYYPIVSFLNGGELIVNDISITPKMNRAVFMSKGELHKVNAYSGDRVSLAINMFNKEKPNDFNT
jgi:hypothetical protein